MLQHGHMLDRLIIINILSFILIGIFIRYLFPSIYPTVLDYLALSSNLRWNLFHPWVFITHLFLHAGIFHIFWNMLLYYWFGTIVGDLVGDGKILPLFLYGGLLGAAIYLLSYAYLIPHSYLDSRALGASAGVMATVVAAGLIAPDYKIRLILIGPVSIKYVVVVLIIIDLVGTTGMNNTGGHFAHLGGALMGWIFVSNLKRGNDLGIPVNRGLAWLSDLLLRKKGSRSRKLRALHSQRSGKIKPTVRSSKSDSQDRINEILDKINQKGYEGLSDEEKEFLFRASNKEK